MAPSIPSSKLTLSCPLFAADFDPRNNDFLLVGGGGGEGRSGVGNQIASIPADGNAVSHSTANRTCLQYLLDASRRETLSMIATIDLSRDEDSVASLGVAHSDDKAAVVFAGINSSQEEQRRNENQHLRSFRIGYPKRRASTSGKKGSKKEDKVATGALSRVSLFTPEKAPAGKERETYQRILRLSPWRGDSSPRIAAIATGFAPQGEIVLFDPSTPTPKKSDTMARIVVGTGLEAEDLDLATVDDVGHFRLAFTDGSEVYMSEIYITQRPAATNTKSVYKVPVSGCRGRAA